MSALIVVRPLRVAAVLLSLHFFCGTGESQNETTALTVYNQDLALVKEVRKIELEKGANLVKFSDVASSIDPTSVHFKSLTDPDGVAILEQNYEYDLSSPMKILEKYLDRNVSILAKGENLHEGTLISFKDGDIVLMGVDQIRIVKLETIENIQLQQIEGVELITKPTLVWLLESDKAGEHSGEISYLTSGIEWHAEYVAVVGKDEKKTELGGWVTIDNRSGTDYKDAQVKLVAGDVHRVKEKLEFRRRRFEVMAKVAVPQFEERAFFEYHLYSLDRKTTIKDNQIKQLSLFPNTEVESRKVYYYDGTRDDKKVKVKLEFKNSEKAGLGMALPGGKVRVYKKDVDEALEFIGEDKIDHTPLDEEVRLILGDAFDVVGERIVANRRKITDRIYDEDVGITLRNHKDEDIEVVVVEHIWGFWEIPKKSHDFKRKDAQTLEFKVPVKAGGEEKLQYTVRHR